MGDKNWKAMGHDDLRRSEEPYNQTPVIGTEPRGSLAADLGKLTMSDETRLKANTLSLQEVIDKLYLPTTLPNESTESKNMLIKWLEELRILRNVAESIAVALAEYAR